MDDIQSSGIQSETGSSGQEKFIRERLSGREALILKRRRAGLSQRDMARSAGKERWVYQIEEQSAEGEREATLTQQEWCKLMRERSGRSQKSICGELRVSRMWLNRMERGEAPCDRLLTYWGFDSLDESKITAEPPQTQDLT